MQALLSGLAFGGLHFCAFAGLRIAVMAQAATVVPGWALAGLYLLSRRSLWPRAVAHAWIDVALEPTLLLSFVH